ncbi:MAG: Crp/Fnr family transcriptional regulator [Chitinophagaceae bacterium]|nr:Crp/Fnr family transcriptional regulator [Chitinophagaceae bacterium]
MLEPIDIHANSDFLFQFIQKFGKLTRQEFDQLVPYFHMRYFDKKTILLQKGDVEDHLSVVVKGLVRKFIKVRGNEITLQLATEGHMIQSEVSFHTRTPSDVILETLEPTSLISMDYQGVQDALEKIPNAEELGRLIISYMFIKKDSRYYSQLKSTTRERFLEYMNVHPHMLQRVPQKILASYLNIKPETFSRLKHLVRPAKDKKNTSH